MQHLPTAVEYSFGIGANSVLCVRRWFNGMQLASLLGSLGLCYWQFTAKKANAMDSAVPVFASQGMV